MENSKRQYIDNSVFFCHHIDWFNSVVLLSVLHIPVNISLAKNKILV